MGEQQRGTSKQMMIYQCGLVLGDAVVTATQTEQGHMLSPKCYRHTQAPIPPHQHVGLLAAAVKATAVSRAKVLQQ